MLGTPRDPPHNAGKPHTPDVRQLRPGGGGIDSRSIADSPCNKNETDDDNRDNCTITNTGANTGDNNDDNNVSNNGSSNNDVMMAISKGARQWKQ